MLDFPYINLLALVTSLITFISPVIMVAIICTRMFPKGQNISNCSKETVRKQKEKDYLISENVGPDDDGLSTREVLNCAQNKSNIDTDNYFERRKKSKRIYFTFIPKVRENIF